MRTRTTIAAMSAVGIMTMTAGARLTLAGADPGKVVYVDARTVTAAFAKGMPLAETGGYKVHASRRDGAGMAEVHVRDTDVIYVLEGTATIVAGGRVVDGRATAVDEVRGASIQGGESRQLSPGDVMIVPNGTPHQFLEVGGPFLYYVVKVTSSGGGSR